MTKFNFRLKIKLPTNFSKISFSKISNPDNPKTNLKLPDSSSLTPENLTKFLFQSKIKFTASQMGKNNLIFLSFKKPNPDNNLTLSNRDNSEIAVCNFSFKFQNCFSKNFLETQLYLTNLEKLSHQPYPSKSRRKNEMPTRKWSYSGFSLRSNIISRNLIVPSPQPAASGQSKSHDGML